MHSSSPTRTPRTEHFPVLVCGAGPAGLACVASLARLGIDALLVERREGPAALPRATSISTRSMELLRSWGLERRVRAGGVEVDWLMWVCPTLARAGDGAALDGGLPTRAQSAAISPSMPACVPQDHLEPVLLEHVNSLRAGRVALGTELEDLEVSSDGVRAVLRDMADGSRRDVSARYLVAADGAYSSVRAALGIPMRGPDRLAQAISVLFRAPLLDVVGEPRYGLYAVDHPKAPGTFLPAGTDDRWLYGVIWGQGQDRPTALDEAGLAERIQIGSGVPGLRPEIERIGEFDFAAQLADRYRHGAAFLAGDAAHRVTPRGGTGLNIALQDGHDLGWKLAWVLNGWAGDELLDTYEAERRPIAEHNVRRSADPDGSKREASTELPIDLGPRIPHAWLPRPGGWVSTLDLLGPGFTMFAGPEHSGRAPHASAGVLVRRVDAGTARALGLDPDGALVVRPDGVPADGRTTPGADLALAGADLVAA